MKHIPLRSCIVCRAQKQKSELVRIVKKADGAIVIDESGREPGRGAYICRSGGCIDLAVKKRALDRAYKSAMPPEAYEALRREFDKINGAGADGN